MSLIQIDRDKCNKDAICVNECPVAIIRLGEEDGYPEIAPESEAACLACGHCVAVCPFGALSHQASPLDLSPEIDRAAALDEKQAVQFLRSRRSIRVFKDKPVEREKIERLIWIGRYAPTAGNSQAVRWLVIDERDKLKAIAGRVADFTRKFIESNPDSPRVSYLPLIVAAWDMGFDVILRDAPALVTAYAPKEDLNGLVNVTLALSYLELAAPTLGLGATWAGLLHAALVFDPALAEDIGLPPGHTNQYPMMIGYPKFKYQRLPERKEPDILWK